MGSKGERKPPTSVVGIANPLHEYDAHPKNNCENQFAGEQNVYKGLEHIKVCEDQSDCDDKRNLRIAENARENFRKKPNALDIVKAEMPWQGLEPVLSDAISRVKQTAIGKVCPASFGRIQSQSGSLVKSATIISEAMDDVILQTKDESHRELI